MSFIERMVFKAAGSVVESGLKELQKREAENNVRAQLKQVQAAVTERDMIIKGLQDQLSDRQAEVAQLMRLINELEADLESMKTADEDEIDGPDCDCEGPGDYGRDDLDDDDEETQAIMDEEARDEVLADEARDER